MAKILKTGLFSALGISVFLSVFHSLRLFLVWAEAESGIYLSIIPLISIAVILAIVALIVLVSGRVVHKSKAPDQVYWAIGSDAKGITRAPFAPSNPSSKIKEEKILTMSGGGYKAGLFHLGSLQRLNEVGELGKINAFSSVSGGSITLAWLGAKWSELEFEDGRASNFDELIYRPLFDFYTLRTLDAPSIARSFVSRKTASNHLANRLNKSLFHNRTLADFPNPNESGSPIFYINSTDLRTNTTWYFTRHPYYGGYAQNWRIGRFQREFALSDVVAASAAFPPFFAPLKLELPEPRQSWVWLEKLSDLRPDEASEFKSEAWLGDGGIYDNLGLQRALRYRHVMVSNAGDPFGTSNKYDSSWYAQLRSTVRHMHRQVEQRRKIHFGDMAALQCINLMIWEIDDRLDAAAQDAFNGLGLEDGWKAATFPVRLKRTDIEQAKVIVRHGASLAGREVALGRTWDLDTCLAGLTKAEESSGAIISGEGDEQIL